MHRNWTSAIALALVTGVAAPAAATETITISVIDGYPARSMWLQELTGFFIPEVDRLLAETGNYRIEWQENYGGSIVRPSGVLEGLALGLGDMGVVTTIFHSSPLPSQAISAVTPMISTDARVVARVVEEIAREFPTMRREFEENNQVYLATGVVLDTYQLYSRRPVSGLADVEGGRVAGAGMNLRYIEGIPNAAGVRGGLTEFYNMLQTGLADFALLWPESAATFRIAEVAPYMIKADFGAVNTKTLTANIDFWNSLPQEVQDAIEQASMAYSEHVAEVAMAIADESLASYIAAGGTVVELTEEERREWAMSMPDIALEWARVLDDKGDPGTEMLVAYIEKLREAGYEPVRDWTAGLSN